MLWLVNLAGRNLLYNPLKFNVGFVAKRFHDLATIVNETNSAWNVQKKLYQRTSGINSILAVNYEDINQSSVYQCCV